MGCLGPTKNMGEYEIVGVHLGEWDEDMFFVNLLLPPFVVWFSLLLGKWIKGAEKQN